MRRFFCTFAMALRRSLFSYFLLLCYARISHQFGPNVMRHQPRHHSMLFNTHYLVDRTSSRFGSMVGIELDLAMEKQLLLRREPPIATLTWFRAEATGDADNDDTELALQQRLQERANQILQVNPWLNGRIKGNLLEYYDPNEGRGGRTTVRTAASTPLVVPIRVLNKKDSSSFFDLEDPLSAFPNQLYQATKDWTKVDESNGPLWQITVLPSVSSPTPTPTTSSSGMNNCGGHEQAYFAVILSISHLIADIHTYYQIYNMLVSSVVGGDGANSDNIVSLEISNHGDSAISDKQAEEWIIGKDAWKFQNSPVHNILKGALGLLEKAVLQRPSREYWLQVNSDEIQKIKKELRSNSINVSTNDILTSWFFEYTKCKVGLLCCNYRGKLTPEGQDDSPTSSGSTLGRNYWGAHVYTPETYKSPLLLRKGRILQQRSPTSISSGSATKLPSPWHLLFEPMAVASSWTTKLPSSTMRVRPSKKTNEPVTVQVHQHVPLYDFASFCPANYCVMRTWTCDTQQQATTGVYLAGDARFLHDLDGKGSSPADGGGTSLPPFLSKMQMIRQN